MGRKLAIVGLIIVTTGLFLLLQRPSTDAFPTPKLANDSNAETSKQSKIALIQENGVAYTRVPATQPADLPYLRWQDFSLQRNAEWESTISEQNLDLTPDQYGPLERSAESGDAEAAFQLYLLHRGCAYASTQTESEIQRLSDRIDEFSTESDVEHILNSAKRFYGCQQFQGNHKLRAYHFLSLAAQMKYPPATMAFLADARNLIQDQLFQYPALVTEHLILRQSVLDEAAYSCTPMVQLQAAMDFRGSGTLGANMPLFFLYTHLAELASAKNPAQSNAKMMADVAADKLPPEKLRDLRARVREIHNLACP